MESQRMQCMEILGGNRTADQHFETVGLDVYINSMPYGSDDDGGDLYYLTSCASGRISRLLLADVSGHGAAVANIAVGLRDLLRANVNTIKQDKFVMEMNRKFSEVSSDSTFATAVVATFFAPTKRFTIGLAGHPNPIYYSARKRKWLVVAPPESEAKSKDPDNLPLGVMNAVCYPSKVIQGAVGDMILMYSDAFIESVDSNGEMLGLKGLMNCLGKMKRVNPEDVIPFVRNEIKQQYETNLSDDDATLMLSCVTRSKVRLRDNLMAPFRLFRSARDRTAIDKCC